MSLSRRCIGRYVMRGTQIMLALCLALAVSLPAWAQDAPDPPVEEEPSSVEDSGDLTQPVDPEEEAVEPTAEEPTAEEPTAEEPAAEEPTAEFQPDPRWFDDYQKLNGAYLRMSTEYQNSLRGFMQDEVNALINAASSHRQDVVDQSREIEAKRRMEAIGTMESFIARYDRYRADPQYREHIADTLFKLAELYREQAEYRMDMDAKLFAERMTEYEWGIRPSPPNEADADYTRSIDIYARIIKEFKDYRYRDMVMYLQGYYLRLSEKVEESMVVLTEMTGTYPDSKYVIGGWMLLGHNAYDLSEYKVAIKAYSAVAKVKKNNPSYEDALYRLGWASFEEFSYEPAIASFLALLDFGEEQTGQKKQRIALRKEAIESIANSFVDEDWDGNDLPDADYGPQRALSFVSQGKDYEKEIILTYANLLYDMQDAKHYQHAVVAFQEYLNRDPYDANNPEVHDRMVYAFFDLSQAVQLPDSERAMYAERANLERKRMAELYGKGSKWAEMHRYDAEALKLAATKLSANLLDRAQLLHQTAQTVADEQGVEAAKPYYEKAGAGYADFLDQFPGSPKYAEMLDRYASVALFGLEDNRLAAKLYSDLRDLELKNNPFRENAANSVLESRARLVNFVADAGDENNPVPEKLFDPQVGTTLATFKSTNETDPTAVREITAVSIPQVVLEWVAAADKIVQLSFEGKDNHEQRGMLRYQIAKIHFRYGHFKEARELYEQVLKDYGKHALLSVYCFLDLARTYRLENDLDNLELVANRMKQEVKTDEGKEGKDIEEVVGEILTGIKDARLKARFQRAGALLTQAKAAQEEEKDTEARDLYSKAAFELEKIVDENPTFDKADVALLEAGRSFEQVQLYEKAAHVYKRLVEEERFVKSEHRQAAVQLLAENYQKFFNFNGAVRTYLKLAEDYPKKDAAKGALLQAAMLYENDQQYLKAADVIYRYMKLYPKDELIGKFIYSLINLHERAEDHDGAKVSLKKFLKKYGRDKDLANRVMTATIKLGRIAEDEGNKKAAQKHYKNVGSLYEKNFYKEPVEGQPKEPPSNPKAAALCAEAQFRLAESRFEEYASITLEGKSKQQKKAMDQKRKKLIELEAVYSKLLNYESVGWSVAAVYKVGALWKDLSDALANAPYPADLPDDEDMKLNYSISIGDLKARFEDKARSLWRQGVEMAIGAGVYNEWTQKILVELNKYADDRERYPLYREVKQFTADEPVLHFLFAE